MDIYLRKRTCEYTAVVYQGVSFFYHVPRYILVVQQTTAASSCDVLQTVAALLQIDSGVAHTLVVNQSTHAQPSTAHYHEGLGLESTRRRHYVWYDVYRYHVPFHRWWCVQFFFAAPGARRETLERLTYITSIRAAYLVWHAYWYSYSLPYHPIYSYWSTYARPCTADYHEGLVWCVPVYIMFRSTAVYVVCALVLHIKHQTVESTQRYPPRSPYY